MVCIKNNVQSNCALMFLSAKPGDSLFQTTVASGQQLTEFANFQNDLEQIMFAWKDEWA